MDAARRAPTISDVARHAGVSKGLVSFALNGRPGVAERTRERILASARELGWSPSLRGRALSTGRSFACGLVIGRSSDVIAADPFFHSFIAGIEDELAAARQVLVLAVATPGREEADTYRDLAADGRVDGVILTDLRSADPRIALVAGLGLSAVTLGVPDTASPFPSVSVDDGVGVRRAVAHLVALGHRRIAHVAGPDGMLHAARRRDAFLAAAAAAGVAATVIATDFSAGDGARATAALLGLGMGGPARAAVAVAPDAPTAIVYANDHMAVAGIGAAQRLGLRVPEDLSVTGFDDTELGRHIHPALTTVSTDAREWGAVAARTLLASVDGADPVHVVLPEPTLTVRGSTGPAPRHRGGIRG